MTTLPPSSSPGTCPHHLYGPLRPQDGRSGEEGLVLSVSSTQGFLGGSWQPGGPRVAAVW